MPSDPLRRTDIYRLFIWLGCSSVRLFSVIESLRLTLRHLTVNLLPQFTHRVSLLVRG